MISHAELQQKFTSVWPLLDERTRRLFAANEAASLGYGGMSAVHLACGLSRRSIAKGIREIQEGPATTMAERGANPAWYLILCLCRLWKQ
jgi:hypothetical protein